MNSLRRVGVTENGRLHIRYGLLQIRNESANFQEEKNKGDLFAQAAPWHNRGMSEKHTSSATEHFNKLIEFRREAHGLLPPRTPAHPPFPSQVDPLGGLEDDPGSQTGSSTRTEGKKSPRLTAVIPQLVPRDGA